MTMKTMLQNELSHVGLLQKGSVAHSTGRKALEQMQGFSSDVGSVCSQLVCGTGLFLYATGTAWSKQKNRQPQPITCNLRNLYISTELLCYKSLQTGLEPTIPGLGGCCLIHYATDFTQSVPTCQVSIWGVPYQNHFWCKICDSKIVKMLHEAITAVNNTLKAHKNTFNPKAKLNGIVQRR